MSQNQTTDNTIVSQINKAHMWRMAFFGLIILIAGIAIGGSSMLIFAPDKIMKPPRGPEFASGRMVGQLHRELRLSPEQAEKIEPILKEHMETLHNIRIDAQDEIGKALEKMNKQISSILTERQKRIWESSLHRVQSPLRDGPRRGEGPGGGRFRRGEQDRPRRGPGSGGPGPGPFGPRRRPAGPNTPQEGAIQPFEDPPQENF